MTADPVLPTTPASRRCRPFWLWLVAGAFLITTVFLVLNVGFKRPSPPLLNERPLEVLRSGLVLQDDRLHQIDQTNFFTGAMVEYYEDRVLKSRSMVSNGLLHGLSEGWHTNGQLQVTEHFREGISHGLRTKWYPAGVKRSEATIVQGQIDGTFRQWHQNGALAEQIAFKAGEPHGRALAYFESGSLKTKATMDHGKVIDHQTWSDGASPGTIARAAPPPSSR